MHIGMSGAGMKRHFRERNRSAIWRLVRCVTRRVEGQVTLMTVRSIRENAALYFMKSVLKQESQ
jgi:hypothetical protein